MKFDGFPVRTWPLLCYRRECWPQSVIGWRGSTCCPNPGFNAIFVMIFFNAQFEKIVRPLLEHDGLVKSKSASGESDLEDFETNTKYMMTKNTNWDTTVQCLARTGACFLFWSSLQRLTGQWHLASLSFAWRSDARFFVHEWTCCSFLRVSRALESVYLGLMAVFLGDWVFLPCTRGVFRSVKEWWLEWNWITLR